MNGQPAGDRAFIAYGKGRYAEALPLLSELADKGDVSALLAVGWINEAGVTGSSNIEFALSCYRRAARAGSIDAYHRLGRLLVKSNKLDEARAVLEFGAHAGNLPCMCDLGVLLTEHNNNTADFEEGMNWLSAAASKGHLFARRIIIKMESSKKNSIYKMIKMKIELLVLTVKYFKEYFRDWNSDKIA